MNTSVEDGEEETFIIAPGVEDDFVLTVLYQSDVDSDLAVAISKRAGSADVPLEFVVKGMTEANGGFPGVDWNTDTKITLEQLQRAVMDELVATANTGVISSGDADSIVLHKTAVDGDAPTSTEVRVYWRWKYEGGNDAGDTQLGTDSYAVASGARSEYILDVTMTATQIAPEVV